MATVPLAASRRGQQIFDVVLIYVIVFACCRRRRCPGRQAAGHLGQRAIDIEVEVAPLDKIQANFMQVGVPEDSHLNGVTIQELRLPRLTVVAAIVREGAAIPAEGGTRIRGGDELLIVVPSRHRQRVEDRFARVSRYGRLASWLDDSDAPAT